jgi:pimeloyl-ACP methyl ester carboxylesterase
MLAYHVAVGAPKVKGIVGMCFLNMQEDSVRKGTSSNDIVVWAPVMRIADVLAPTPLGAVSMPFRWLTKMDLLINNDAAAQVALNDPTSAGALVSLRFLNSYLVYVPEMQPEEFSQCPILLTQPAADKWTPMELTTPFTSRLHKVPSFRVVQLENAGHYPLEEPGIDQLHDALHAFVLEMVGQK